MENGYTFLIKSLLKFFNTIFMSILIRKKKIKIICFQKVCVNAVLQSPWHLILIIYCLIF